MRHALESERAELLARLAEIDRQLHAKPQHGQPGAAKLARMAEQARRRAAGDPVLSLDLDAAEFPE